MSQQWISINEFFKCKTDFNEENFRRIRQQYRKQCGGQFLDSPTKSILNQLADQFQIKLKSAESRELSDDCLCRTNDSVSRTVTESA